MKTKKEESVFSKTSVPPKETENIKPPEKINKLEYVYEIKVNKAEGIYTIFSEKIKINDDFLVLSNAFARYQLIENINPKLKYVITELGRQELSIKNPEIPLTEGIHILKTPLLDWMIRTEEETKKAFDEKVLKAYRDYHKKLSQSLNQEEEEEVDYTEQPVINKKKSSKYEGINRPEINDL